MKCQHLKEQTLRAKHNFQTIHQQDLVHASNNYSKRIETKRKEAEQTLSMTKMLEEQEAQLMGSLQNTFKQEQMLILKMNKSEMKGKVKGVKEAAGPELEQK